MNKITKEEYPVEQVLDLTYQGLSRKEISEELDISLPQVKRIRLSADYKELDYERQTELRLIRDAEAEEQIQAYVQLEKKARTRLEELCESQNEKIALDAAKFLSTHQEKLKENAVMNRIQELEAMIEKFISP